MYKSSHTYSLALQPLYMGHPPRVYSCTACGHVRRRKRQYIGSSMHEKLVRTKAVYGSDHVLQAWRKFKFSCQGHAPLAIPCTGQEVKGQGQHYPVSCSCNLKASWNVARTKCHVENSHN